MICREIMSYIIIHLDITIAAMDRTKRLCHLCQLQIHICFRLFFPFVRICALQRRFATGASQLKLRSPFALTMNWHVPCVVWWCNSGLSSCPSLAFPPSTAQTYANIDCHPPQATEPSPFSAMPSLLAHPLSLLPSYWQISSLISARL